MIAIDSPCQACGWVFYGFSYAGEPCSAECDAFVAGYRAAVARLSKNDVKVTGR